MLEKSQINKQIKKTFKNHSFIILQLIIWLFTLILVLKNWLIFLDINLRWYLMEFRSKLINQIKPEFTENEKKIVLVWIDEKFFNNEKISIQWFHRWYYAKAFQNINNDNPNIIWVDVFFQNKYDFWSWDNDKKVKILNQIFSKFDEELAQNVWKKIVLATLYSFVWKKILFPANIFLQNNSLIWHVHSSEYEKWINLWVQPELIDNTTNEKIYPLSIQVYLNYIINNYNKLHPELNWAYQYWISKNNNILSMNMPGKIIQIPISNNNWNEFLFTPIYVFKWLDVYNYISFYDVYKWDFPKWYFTDKIVYIWAIDRALNDIKLVLNWQIEWVMVHYNQTLWLLNHDNIYLLSNKESQLLIFALMMINFIMLWVYKKNLKSHLAIFYLLIIELFIVFLWWIYLSFWWIVSWLNYSIFLPIWTLSITITLQILISWIYYLLTTFSSKKIFQKLFALYVWEHISEQKSNQFDEDTIGKKVAEQKKVALFFSDIAWFTSISEKLSPEQNINILNEYLEEMSSVIAKNHWYIDKYIWDAIMAFWQKNDNKCDNAALSAIWNIYSLDIVNSKINKILKITNNSKLIDIRIWLHYSDVVVWDIWSIYKLNYTVIWDWVNLASRLEWINKYYETKIIMSSDFRNNITNKESFICRKLDRITVKWKEKPIDIYELLPYYKKEILSDKINVLYSVIDKFNKWLEAYFDWKFEFAITYFEEANAIRPDWPSKIFINRCNILKTQPLNEWDWVRKHDQK